jgi:signal transduction histidine kinase
MGATGEVNDGQRRILNTVKQNVDRLAQLVEDVLKVAQIDSGRDQLKPEPLNLNELIEKILENIKSRGLHESKNLKVSFTAESDETIIEADLSKINQILANVIDNAFNYTTADGNIDIHVKTEDKGNNVLITVQDSGVGIPETFRENVWRRFERHDETALTLDVAGTGLGLPIVKDLVEMHNGRVWFDSEVGVGTTFYITLPIKQSSPYIKSVSTAAGGD